MKHRHTVKETRVERYTSPADPKHRGVAHGGITEIDVCRCGATRRTDVNGLHASRGKWEDATD